MVSFKAKGSNKVVSGNLEAGRKLREVGSRVAKDAQINQYEADGCQLAVNNL